MYRVDLHRTRTVLAVIEHGSVSAAADALGFTQSAVSQQLSTLERDIGLTLVDRARRPLRPTPAGAGLLPELQALVERAGAVDAAVSDLRGLSRGSVELVAFASAMATIVPPVVAAFREEHPSVVVGVAEAETDEALAALRAGEAEVALVHLMPGQEIADDDWLTRVPLGRDALHAVLPKGHPLAARRELALDDLASEPLIVPRAGSRTSPFRVMVESLVAERGAELRVAYEVDDPRGAQAFVAAGFGIVLMHGLILEPAPAGVVVRPLATAEGARQVEALRPSARRSPAARALTEAFAVRPLPPLIPSREGSGAPRPASRRR